VCYFVSHSALACGRSFGICLPGSIWSPFASRSQFSLELNIREVFQRSPLVIPPCLTDSCSRQKISAWKACPLPLSRPGLLWLERALLAVFRFSLSAFLGIFLLRLVLISAARPFVAAALLQFFFSHSGARQSWWTALIPFWSFGARVIQGSVLEVNCHSFLAPFGLNRFTSNVFDPLQSFPSPDQGV